MLGRRAHWFAAAYLLVAGPCAAFLPDFWSRALTLSWDSHTHQDITERAILNLTMDTLSGVNKRTHDKQDQSRLGRGFWSAVGEVVTSNAAMDFLSSTRSDPVFHFDSERVEGATAALRQAWAQTLLSLGAGQHQSARRSLGQLFHSLQPEEPAVPLAHEDTPTCMECFSATCRGNLMPHLGLLTTGYFSQSPSKPEGKCSHGGILDSSRRRGAKGGINKDSTSPLFSPHHYLHAEAARLASEATLTVLKDLRDTVGHAPFLRLFSVQQPPSLVFVLDTTGSMFEEISAARLRALAIIQGRADSGGQPGTYLLVPFHDPEVGPVYQTDDPEQFIGYMEDLMALGGGDEPEMCFSAIQLALTHSPPLSEIFVFTDASPKDAQLFSSVKALALQRRCKVTFLLTEDPSHKSSRRRKRSRGGAALSPDRFSLYSALSAVSGGLTVFTTNSHIHKVSAIVEDSTVANKVTLLHVEIDGGEVECHHPFRVDGAVSRVVLHLTGKLNACTLTDPSGVSQSLLSLAQSGPLAEFQSFEGLNRVRLLSPVQPGQWNLHTSTQGPATLNILGDSRVDFLYYFATVANQTHPGLSRVEGSPIAGVPTFLVLTVKGLAPDVEASFSHVTLLGAHGESLQKELVGVVDRVPRVPFCVRLSGRDGSGDKLERVFCLSHDWYRDTAPSFLVAEKGSVRRQVDLLTPTAAEPGATVTLTLSVHALDSLDSNYAVAYLTVVPPDPDMSPPSCSPARLESPCPSPCSGSSWTVSLALSDRGRSGLASLQLLRGEGVLALLSHAPTPPGEGWAGTRRQPDRERPAGPTLEKGEPPLNVSERGQPMWVRYRASCCAPHAELLVWDRAGNLRRCHLTSGQQGGLGVRHSETNGSGSLSSCCKEVLLLLLGLWTHMALMFVNENKCFGK
ncbi:hypothetical protein NHX12_009308 [Muraenolepis orangiensis]|uniref:von Willebrand factor A domain-containing protein 7 n=1 Tax=Muraenolepis orangiensis TaxID=630683 RepID=A0A9Q0DPT7_9TELE|nr:hypothetical protein NHX12_009308 [Muraenolepis orangiensis]